MKSQTLKLHVLAALSFCAGLVPSNCRAGFRRQTAACLLLSLLTLAAAIGLAFSAGAVSVGPAGYTNDFSNPASITNAPPTGWWTKSVFGGDGSTISTFAQLDASVSTNFVGSITNAIPASPIVGPPTADGLFCWNSTSNALQSRPTGNMYSLLLCTLQNDSGSEALTLELGYELSVIDPGGVTEELLGHRLYYSLTGAAGSWNAIGSYSNQGRISLSLGLSSPWAVGSSLYLLWADDNGSGADYAYMIDNLFVKAAPRDSGK